MEKQTEQSQESVQSERQLCYVRYPFYDSFKQQFSTLHSFFNRFWEADVQETSDYANLDGSKMGLIFSFQPQ